MKAHRDLGAAYAASGRLDEAEESYRACIDLWAKHSDRGSMLRELPPVLDELAGLLDQRQRKEEAESIRRQGDALRAEAPSN